MKYIFLCSFLFSTAAMAASGGHGDAHGIPGDVKWQAINLSVFILIIFFAARKKVRALFSERFEAYHRVARETEKARKELEEKRADMTRLLKTLRETSAQSLAQAKIDAENAKHEQILKAKEEAARIVGEAKSQLKSDYAKLMEKLRLEALEMSMMAAENKLETLASAEKSKHSAGFVKRVEGATV